MIANHAQFIAALEEKRKVRVQFYSLPDNGVLDRVCAPIDYGPGADNKDGLNRYWLWDYASNTGSHTLGLVPQQIEDLQVLGEVFDPAQIIVKASPAPVVVPSGNAPPAPDVSPAGGKPSIL